MKIKESFKELNVETFVTDYLKSRGIEDVQGYLNASWGDRDNPCDYDNIQEAYECMCKHHDNGDKLGILVDVDSDGEFSASLLHNYLLDIEYNGEIIPIFHDLKKHGLTDEDVMKKITESGCKLLFCPDSSSSDYEQHKILHDLEIDVVCLDHHEFPHYSEHAIVINNQLSPKVENRYGSGALVTHKFCQYVDLQIGFEYAEKYYDRVALSLITDVCDLTSFENRFYVDYGLQNINDKVILDLIEVKMKDKEINSHNLSWNVNPCLNSYIRNSKAEWLYKALVFPNETCMWQRIKKEELKEWNIVDRVVTESIAMQTKQSNDVRKYVKQLEEQINEDDKAIIVTVDEKFNLAYTGLIAGKLSGNYGKPALVVHEKDGGKLMGSVRSDSIGKEEFDKSGLFLYNSGHQAAFGTAFKKENLDKIRDYFNSLNIASELTCDVVKCFNPTSVPTSLFELIEETMWLYGKGVDLPTFCIKNIKINADEIKWYPTVMFFVHEGIRYTKFFPNEVVKNAFMKDTNKKLDITIVGTMGINEYQGYRNPQFLINFYEVKEQSRVKSIEDIW